MTRGCHPNCENPQTDSGHNEKEGEGIATRAIVTISSEIWPQRPAEPKSYLKCSNNAPQRVPGEEIGHCGRINGSCRAVAETVKDHEGIEYRRGGGILQENKE